MRTPEKSGNTPKGGMDAGLSTQAVQDASINDPQLGKQWFLGNMGVYKAWETATGKGIRIGVADEDILDDYELTNRFRSGRRLDVLRPQLAEKGIDVDRYRALFVAPRLAMVATLTGLNERYGSIEGYVRHEAGVTPAVIADLRSHLLR